jgi:hypothetical protein
MDYAEKAVTALKESLFPEVAIGGLMARNKVAHKWKTTYRSLQLRECVHWRLQDLLEQAVILHKQGHVLGGRILLRSAFETVAVLIYLNQQMAKVLDGTVNFHAFSKKTETLVMGSRNASTPLDAINILTMLDAADKKYTGIRKLYDGLSESAHPNYAGLSDGYTKIDHDEYVVTFTNRWMEFYGDKLEDSIMLCIETFTHEYNNEWCATFEKLEKWIEDNDAVLEATKNEPIPN